MAAVNMFSASGTGVHLFTIAAELVNTCSRQVRTFTKMKEWNPGVFQTRLLTALGSRTRQEVGEAARVSHTTVTRWLLPHGRPNPCVASLWRVARVRGGSGGWVIGEAATPVGEGRGVAEQPGAAAHLAVEQALGAGATVEQVVSQLRLVTRAAKAR